MEETEQFITFVCTGNTCRSPMAEKLFLHAIGNEAEPIKSLKAASAGLTAYEGSPPSANSVKALKDCGLDINGHRAQSLTQEMIDQSLAIFCMTHVHMELINLEFDIDDHPIYLLREFLPSEKNKDVPDPFGQNIEAYKVCRDSIVEAIPSIIHFLKNDLLKK